ncbi:MAG: cysteine peptidase family C39 domain-containing protein [Planctomycetes bacterium]|nr:cysteine peptidase family C39 domain-containing protein [Planctomycetota bacterium]
MRMPFVIACLLVACHAPAPLSPDAIVLDVPSVRQDEADQCGLVALEALARYWGRTIPDELDRELARSAREHHGLSGDELVAALEQSGFEAFLFAGELDASELSLFHHLDRGRPLLVMLELGGDSHYALVAGHDPTTQRLVLLDGRRGRAVMERSEFERAWGAADRFTLLALPLDHE